MKKCFLSLCAALLLSGTAMAQMEFTFTGVTPEKVEQADGSILLQFPDGTDLNNLPFASFKVNGTSVNPASITPNPTTTFISEMEIETFVYDGKAYSFRFTAGQYFTVVMFSDPHVAEGSGISVADMQTKATNMINSTYTFDELPGYQGKADIVFCLGDMDTDNASDANDFNSAMKPFADAKIPFITLTGNHDLLPDYYWNNGDLTYNLTGTSHDRTSLNAVKSHYNTAATNGGFTVDRIYDTECDANFVIEHFAFKYKGVRFYCANNYWFQKSHDSGSLTTKSEKTYAADGTINALKAYLEKKNSDGTSYKEDPAVWVSHYPFYSEANNFNDASARWWLDQSNSGDGYEGRCLMPVDAASSEFYGTGSSVPVYTSDEGRAIAEKKRKALADIIVQTKNPRHFSGHSHKNDGQDVTANNGVSFRDHTIQPITNTGVSNNQEGNTFAVLCKAGRGIIAVKRVTF